MSKRKYNKQLKEGWTNMSYEMWVIANNYYDTKIKKEKNKND